VDRFYGTAGTGSVRLRDERVHIGYYGRSGTVQVSRTPVVRPRGKHKDPTDDALSYGPSGGRTSRRRSASSSGRRPPRHAGALSDFADHVFGVCLVDDWSARDIQAWGVRAPGPLPRQVAPDLGLPVGGPAGRSGGRAPSLRNPPPLPYLRDDEHPWSWTSRSRCALDGDLVSRPPPATRTFLEDGDTVTIGATAPGTDGGRISLCEVTGRVEPAR
jgi:fumarylacetoacetase